MKTCSLAHSYWEKLLKPGDTVIDATLGNGHDTKIVAHLLKGSGKIYGYDIQPQALHNASLLFNSSLSEKEQSNISLIHASHENFTIPKAHLIIYNLGYLPGGDKTITTRGQSTLQSLSSACAIVEGAISVMCYIGHKEGEREFKHVFSFFQSLSPKDFLVCHHTWINREKAPTFFWCERLK